ncbi:FERM domain-containing protein 6 [Astyanax mexicanus]|uniref:FERM domain-containing protein 6 n=1 Tax=Astyanax mexicanus TaxID=7994 RepID=UPI0020CB591C|nr:FERM domain-containing protein 6 [Astyanax mexicanus]XP_049321102.1 FERM domain-containing protein 6 [Astyanax mexicanus]
MASRTDQTRVVCVVLPNKNQLNITVGLKCRGQEVINQLSEQLGIQDLHLFGLCLEKDNDHLFLDLENKLSIYFPQAWKLHTMQKGIVLHLKVQYYIRDGRLITEEKVRSLYYADLKGRVLCSQCSGQEGQYFQLAAYALQADLGDWTEREESYFKPHDYFPPWILTKLGCDYVLQHTPVLHRELLGMCVYDAVLLFIQEACRISDVPVVFYHMSKEKKEHGTSVLVGLALTGLHVDERMMSGEQLLLYEFPWSSIDRINFQGKRFEIRAEGLAESGLILYTRSLLHSQHLLKHMSSIHRLHLKTKHSVKQLLPFRHRAGGKLYREVCVKEKSDADTDTETEDELPPLKSHIVKARTLREKPVEPVPKITPSEIEMCVDEPEEMFVDDPDDIRRMIELLEGVSVDGPQLMPLIPLSPWKNVTMEMKEVLKWRACSVSMDSLWNEE